MDLRPERPGDEGAIRTVIALAFLEADYSDGRDAEIVDGLRHAGSLTVSLVATKGDRILGHVAFSPVMIDGRDDDWFGLGPVSVVPSRQRQGIGTALINAGLAGLRDRGAKGCVVLGDPVYYRRFGFAVDQNLRLDGVPPGYFQGLSFTGRRMSGSVSYHPAFGVD